MDRTYLLFFYARTKDMVYLYEYIYRNKFTLEELIDEIQNIIATIEEERSRDEDNDNISLLETILEGLTEASSIYTR